MDYGRTMEILVLVLAVWRLLFIISFVVLAAAIAADLGYHAVFALWSRVRD